MFNEREADWTADKRCVILRVICMSWTHNMLTFPNVAFLRAYINTKNTIKFVVSFSGRLPEFTRVKLLEMS